MVSVQQNGARISTQARWNGTASDTWRWHEGKLQLHKTTHGAKRQDTSTNSGLELAPRRNTMEIVN
jgi:hypothetical protein